MLYMQGIGQYSSKHFTNTNSFESHNKSLEIGTIIIPIW